MNSVKTAILSLPLMVTKPSHAEKARTWLTGQTLASLSPIIEFTAQRVWRVVLPVPLLGCVSAWEQQLVDCLGSLPVIEWCVQVPATRLRPTVPALLGVRNIVAVASGKGGVGKSTTAVNLAAALQAEGARVGVLDADIYGPSQPTMLGIAERGQPQLLDNKRFVPHDIHGLQVMSMGFLVTPKTPTVWRGPMVSGALMQLLQQTAWQDLDYLIVDMPPGTGDIQLTLTQHVPVDGALIVTTPQDVACLDARKGIEMFRKVSVPVLGMVENMSIYECPQCGHTASIFGTEGGRLLADEYQVPLLAQMPLLLEIREQMDAGTPAVIVDPESSISARYRCLAREVAVALQASVDLVKRSVPEIEIRDD